MDVARRISRLAVIATAGAVLAGTPTPSPAATTGERCPQRRARERVGTWAAVELPRTPAPPSGIREALPNPPGNRFHAYAVDPSDPETIYVADEWRVLVSNDGGCRWRQAFDVLEEPLPSGEERHIVSLSAGLTPTGGVRVYALIRRGTAGVGTSPCCVFDASVAELATPAASGEWETQPILDTEGAPVVGNALHLKLAPSDAGVLYLVNQALPAVEQDPHPRSHTLYASGDGGATWELRARSVRTGADTYWLGDFSCAGGEERCTGIHFGHLAVDPLEPDVLWSANDSGIFQSTDGGRSWVSRQALTMGALGRVQAVDVHHARKRRVRIAVFGASKTAWSADGARTWALRAPAVVRTFDGGTYEQVQIASIAAGPAKDEFVGLFPWPNEAEQVLVARGNRWLQTSPPFMRRREEGSSRQGLADVTYAAGAYFFLTDDGSHLVTLELRR